MDRAQHWNIAYAQRGTGVSWHQEDAGPSLELIASVATPRASVVDVGGGSSPLVDGLLAGGHRDVTVLDLSEVALDRARDRLGTAAAGVTWIAADLLSWQPARTFDVWHDRAVLHFLTAEEERHQYAALAAESVTPGGHAVLATFALDGPERCSGLPVRRYDAAGLAALLGDAFTPVLSTRELHRTPSGATQAFTWLVARRT